MSSRKKSKQPVHKVQSSMLRKEPDEENLDEILTRVSLRSMSLEEKRKEAQKPLFLTRYE
jgi:hypothetical protein